jgi:hypothetical protein
MKRSLWAIPGIMIFAVLIGASISGGPVIWAILILTGPLAIMMVFAGRGVAQASADTDERTLGERLGDDRLRREGRSDTPIRELAGTPESRRAARLHHCELVARASAVEYAQVHQDD